MKFGSVTNNDIGMKPLNFGYGPNSRCGKNIFSFKRITCGSFGYWMMQLHRSEEHSDVNELSYSVWHQYLVSNVAVPKGILVQLCITLIFLLAGFVLSECHCFLLWSMLVGRYIVLLLSQVLAENSNRCNCHKGKKMFLLYSIWYRCS